MTRLINCILFLPIAITCCDQHNQTLKKGSSVVRFAMTGSKIIGEIPIPQGYKRVPVDTGSFSEWLRDIKLKSDSNIYLYNGNLSGYQSGHYAVLDIPVGDKDLQQCADAILRLRAEYFFSKGDMELIRFTATDGTGLSFLKWVDGYRYKLTGNKLSLYYAGTTAGTRRIQLEQFLKVVFSYCGTISLSKELRPVHDISDLQIGDVFIKPGSPGHAMIVMDAAINDKGEKIFMLGQGFMPAQSIHIVKNLMDPGFSPWYKIANDPKIITPRWTFSVDQLNRW